MKDKEIHHSIQRFNRKIHQGVSPLTPLPSCCLTLQYVSYPSQNLQCKVSHRYATTGVKEIAQKHKKIFLSKTILRCTIDNKNKMSSNSLKFVFDQEKTVQTAALFLKLHKRPMKYLGLLKLLYSADRLALLEVNQTITGDNYISTKHGPVLKKVYRLIKSKHYNKFNSFWKKYFLTTDDFDVKLEQDPGAEDLSEEDEEIIIEVYRKCSSYDKFELEKIADEFPEWIDPTKDPFGRKTIEIDNVKLLKLLGKSNEEIRFISEMAMLDLYIKSLKK